MKLLEPKDYPKSLTIGGETYKIRFAKRIQKDKECLGLCDPSLRVLYIQTGQTPEETFKTLIHEVLHAFEFECGVKLKHKRIDILESAIFDFFWQNF